MNFNINIKGNNLNIFVGGDESNNFNLIGKLNNFKFYFISNLMESLSFGRCIECKKGFFFNSVKKSCDKCYSNCEECSGKYRFNCLQCKNSYYLVPKNNFLKEGLCMASCPRNSNDVFLWVNQKHKYILISDEIYIGPSFISKKILIQDNFEG